MITADIVRSGPVSSKVHGSCRIDGREDFGFNATYQVDWFPHDPLVFSSELDVGSLGDAWLFHFQQTAGVTWRGLEARVGYDYLDIGDAQFSMLLCGVRGWF